MLDEIRRAMRQVAELLLTSKLSEDELEEIERQIVYRLVECDVALEASETIAGVVRELARGERLPKGAGKEAAVRELLRQALAQVLERAKWFNLEEEVERLRSSTGEPVKILFVGPNGHGKTTTLAKLGYRLRRRGLTAVFAAADTWRAGAVEQLRYHAEAVGAEVVAHGYGSDPAAVAYDAVAYARKRKQDVVLIDTAGRMQTDRNLMAEVSKIARVVKPDFKAFVGDALTGNDALAQALVFNQHVGVDWGILTKFDADAKGGAVISFIYATGKPVLYVGTGQRYEDLIPFDVNWYIEHILSS